MSKDARVIQVKAKDVEHMLRFFNEPNPHHLIARAVMIKKDWEQQIAAAPAAPVAGQEVKPVGEYRESEYDGEPAFYWFDKIPPLGTKLYASPPPVAQEQVVTDNSKALAAALERISELEQIMWDNRDAICDKALAQQGKEGDS